MKANYVDWYTGNRLQTWETPPELFHPLNRRYGFTLDGAGSIFNALLPRVSTIEEPISWVGERVFCNPPWSDIPPFVELAAVAELAVLLVPARTNARWFHRALELGAWVEYFEGRPSFLRNGQRASSSPVDCVLLVFGG